MVLNDIIRWEKENEWLVLRNKVGKRRNIIGLNDVIG
jgi:hypothetical protein